MRWLIDSVRGGGGRQSAAAVSCHARRHARRRRCLRRDHGRCPLRLARRCRMHRSQGNSEQREQQGIGAGEDHSGEQGNAQSKRVGAKRAMHNIAMCHAARRRQQHARRRASVLSPRVAMRQRADSSDADTVAQTAEGHWHATAAAATHTYAAGRAATRFNARVVKHTMLHMVDNCTQRQAQRCNS